MPYRVDLPRFVDGALERLVDLGALDVEPTADGGIAALMPDRVSAAEIARALDSNDIRTSPATGRDAGSVWVLSPRAVHAGRLRIVPAHMPAASGDLRLIDGEAFGTGLHPTTALCLEAIDDAVRHGLPDAMLDVGTGSGVLALAALMLGVPRAVGIDVDEEALRVVGENARLNGVADRLTLLRGTPDSVTGAWPFVVANVLAAPLIDMAPSLVRRVAHRGRLVLSGIPASLEPDVDRAYRHRGMRRVGVTSRAGWVALTLDASW